MDRLPTLAVATGSLLTNVGLTISLWCYRNGFDTASDDAFEDGQGIAPFVAGGALRWCTLGALIALFGVTGVILVRPSSPTLVA
jgi:hypothetical protein